MKVSELAQELHCSVKDVQAAARRLEIYARTPEHTLGRTECTRIRELVARDRMTPLPRTLASLERRGELPSTSAGSVTHPAAAPATAAAATAAKFPPSGRDLPRATVRREPAEARAEGAANLLVHPDFVEWLHAPATDERQKRRARLVLWQFFSRGQPSNVKSLNGPGRGWLRTRLGGSNGNQFYLWWTPSGAAPVASHGMPRGATLLRAVRHHDDNDAPIEAGEPASWLPLRVGDVFEHRADIASAFTEQQALVASAGSSVRLIKGHPGTGKTTALWLSTAFAEGSRALYVTYSRRLAAESEQHFRALGPRGMHIDVLTFEELLSEFAAQVPPGAPSPPGGKPARWLAPDEAAERLRVMLGGYQQRRAPWEGHEAELYAELHAHFVGRALPIGFRGLGPSSGPTLSAADYVEARQELLGPAAARAAASIGEYLRRGTALRELMPGPLRARDALEALGEGRPVPPRFQRLDWIFVDEVQDLTLVETLLLVELAVRVGREQQRLPGFVAAGDEGQTVRPTDFEWGPLADLLNERLGSRQEHDLSGNLRSPRNIATVINRSWDLYRRLDKAERPRGYAEADVEETAVGRIIYCRTRSEDDERELLGAFSRTPGSALVHPGYRVPEPWRKAAAAALGEDGGAIDLWTADAAKGLDFQVVGVLDAGRQLDRLHALATQAGEDGRIFALWARTLADQLRVALSRATDTLVLVDRDPSRGDRGEGSDTGDGADAKARLFELCRGEGGAPLEGFLEEMEPRELAELLSHEDADAHSLVAGYVQEIPRLLQDRPQISLRQARHASGLLGSERTPGAVTDLGLRKAVYRLRGVAALLSATDAATGEHERADQFREANTWLHKASLPEAARGALQLRNLRRAHSTPDDVAQDEALALGRALERLQDEIPEADRVFRIGIVEWCRGAANATAPAGIAPKRHLADAVAHLAGQLGARHPELHEHAAKVRRAMADALGSEGHPREALGQYEQLVARDHVAEGRCLEAMGEFARATDRYELAGATSDDGGDPEALSGALRCARRIPDLDRARRLAIAAGARDDEASLDWLREVRELAARAARGRVSLTAEEGAALTAELERSLSVVGASDKRPVRRGAARRKGHKGHNDPA